MEADLTTKIYDFFSSYPLRTYQKGQILLYEGDSCEYVFYIVSGRVKQYDISYRGDEIIINVFQRPAFFPMSAAIQSSDIRHTFEADTDITVHTAPAADAVQFVRDNPDVMYDLLSRVYRGLDGVLGRMSRLMAGSARSRLLYELLIEARRFGVPITNNGLSIQLNEKDLGSRAGLSRETVSREMHRLKQDAVVAITNKEIIILDLHLLQDQLTSSL